MRATIDDIDIVGAVAQGDPSGPSAAPAPTPRPPASGRWLWLFPAVFAVHVAEEGLAGEGFYRWIGRVAGREVAPGTFVAVNLALEAAMVAAVHRATRRDDAAWVAPALGLIGATNGLGHLAGSVATRSYSPGVASGAGLWTPLGVAALLRSRRATPRRAWRRGVAAGLLITASLMPLALSVSRRSAARATPRATRRAPSAAGSRGRAAAE